LAQTFLSSLFICICITWASQLQGAKAIENATENATDRCNMYASTTHHQNASLCHIAALMLSHYVIRSQCHNLLHAVSGHSLQLFTVLLCDCSLISGLLKTFSSMPTHVRNICAKFH